MSSFFFRNVRTIFQANWYFIIKKIKQTLFITSLSKNKVGNVKTIQSISIIFSVSEILFILKLGFLVRCKSIWLWTHVLLQSIIPRYHTIRLRPWKIQVTNQWMFIKLIRRYLWWIFIRGWKHVVFIKCRRMYSNWKKLYISIYHSSIFYSYIFLLGAKNDICGFILNWNLKILQENDWIQNWIKIIYSWFFNVIIITSLQITQ